MNVLRLGQQLAGRGHSFTLLLSAQEHYSQALLTQRLTGNTSLLLYKGDPDFALLSKRPEDKNKPNAARDPAQVLPAIVA